ncbi:uncharacterized protein LOC117824306 [Xyrichtys novacula]|uniref:Uncharacterized protein LOC117824306 n=1 Tax=Xyrichtys novacula TaxID=13765 RepID=A0AAV1GXE5_XYRNO|nr:uncharacterized protein LOC117824306 [Xyrichtys novacula]
MEFKWIQMSLFLTALLHFTATEVQPLDLTVRVGDNIPLTCENLIKDQHECNFTTWTFSHSSNSAAAVELVKLGQVSEDVGSKSDRLSVTEDCSLLIKKVREDDVGRYECRQYPPRGRQEPNAQVFLSGVNMTQQKYDDDVTLTCSVTSLYLCKHTVKWLFEGKDVVEHDQSVRTSKGLCFADVSFQPDHYMYRSRYESLQCEVTVDNQVFSFRLQPSGEKPGCSSLDWIMLSLRVSELVLITVITVLLFRASGNHRPPNDFTVSMTEFRVGAVRSD